MRRAITVPFEGQALGLQGERFARLESLGYEEAWSAETNAADAFTPLVLAATCSSSLRLGTAIVPVYTRGPALLAASASALQSLSKGRFVLGIGASSNVIIEQWNGIPFEKPYARVRDTLGFLDQAFTGNKVDFDGDTFSVHGFRLADPPATRPKVMVAALREGMLRLAGRWSDGAIINWLGAEDVPKVVSIVHDATPADAPRREIVARIFVCPSEDTEAVRHGARMAIAAYLNVPVYAAFHQWLGNGEALAGMWEAWKAGDRKAALREIPDAMVDRLVVHGSFEQCRRRLAQYGDNGVTTAAVALLPVAPFDLDESLTELARPATA